MNLQTTAYALMAVCVGTLFPVQAAVNALLARGVGGAFAATMVSFIAGLIVLLGLNAVVFKQWPRLADLYAQPLPLLWAGGTIGVVFLSSNVFLASRIGVAATFAFAMAGQLLAALLIDRFGLFGMVLRELSLGRVAGVLLVFVGALMVRLA